jgi:5-formyltetrahydrofolate cyclo-ligase
MIEHACQDRPRYSKLVKMEWNKTQWRRWARQQRKELPLEEVAASICTHLAHWLQQHQAQRVLLYAAIEGEPDPSTVQQLWPARYYLPRITGDHLAVHLAEGALQVHRWGVREPLATAPSLDPQQLDAVVVPCLAADRQGFRLGYGKGYYDRFLSRLNPSIPTIGVVPQQLLVEQLPRDNWDLPLQYLVTQQGIQLS